MVEIGFWEVFYADWLRWHGAGRQAVRQFRADLSLSAVGLRGPCAEMAVRLL